MPIKHLLVTLTSRHTSPIRIAYLDSFPTMTTTATILLIHGFPQTSHQFRHVIPLLTAQGYRCIAADYRGAGNSQPAPEPKDFRKSTIASDMIALLDNLNITHPIHVVGHDIGGMVAYALASRWPDRVKSVIWGECPLPGTQPFRLDRTVPERMRKQFHFGFHTVPNLAAALVAGKERMYLEHFFGKITYNLSAFSSEDVDGYVRAYSQPGAMRSAMEVYAAFEKDAEENVEWVARERKCRVPTMVLSGEMSGHREEAEAMVKEVTEEEIMEVGVVKGAGHYLAEEAPEEFASIVLEFLGRH